MYRYTYGVLLITMSIHKMLVVLLEDVPAHVSGVGILLRCDAVVLPSTVHSPYTPYTPYALCPPLV